MTRLDGLDAEALGEGVAGLLERRHHCRLLLLELFQHGRQDLRGAVLEVGPEALGQAGCALGGLQKVRKLPV